MEPNTNQLPDQPFESFADKMAKIVGNFMPPANTAAPAPEASPATAAPAVTVVPDTTKDHPAVAKDAPAVSTDRPTVVATPPELITPVKVDESKDEFSELLKFADSDDYKDPLLSDPSKAPEIEKVEAAAPYVDPYLQDPLVKAAIEYRKSGGSDVAEFVNKLGVVDSKALSAEDLFTIQAKKVLGLQGEELREAVESKMESYESKNIYDQQMEIKALRSDFDNDQMERLKAFSIPKSEEDIRIQNMQKTAIDALEQRVSGLKGKKWLGVIPVDENTVKDIQDYARILSTEIYDSSGKLVNYDVEGGIEHALWHVLGKKAVKEISKAQYAKGYTDAMNERNRPADDVIPPTGAAPKASSWEDAMREARAKINPSVSNGQTIIKP